MVVLGLRDKEMAVVRGTVILTLRPHKHFAKVRGDGLRGGRSSEVSRVAKRSLRGAHKGWASCSGCVGGAGSHLLLRVLMPKTSTPHQRPAPALPAPRLCLHAAPPSIPPTLIPPPARQPHHTSMDR